MIFYIYADEEFRNKYRHVNMYVCVHVCMCSVLRGAKSSEILVTVNMLVPRSSLSSFLQKKELWFLGETVESEARVQKITR